ncbi:hypothetical protein RUESEDTHA_00852 [Ruegeria sp. THAF57]|uniref:hypothetical protein n=1 Tax=Ruegeria sp. THAF57 TaxID=2744555 RepID=UPI0015DE27E9|nr:hypothetical protein [Ruegeria sp. THAF57]CAD0183975.1 hypothetical protein RUESEDTHA_00852 [Ruegeria sp. THAF57]
MSEGPKFTDLVASGDSEALFIQDVMQSSDYTAMNGNENTAHAREVVSSYFRRKFGTGPAPGSRQKNTVGRGGLNK